MSENANQKAIGRFIFLCALVYFTSYISRINLSTTLVEVINSGFSKKDIASLALTLNAVAYGTGQILSGFMGAKFRPQNIIFSGFIITAAVNILVSVLPEKSGFLILLWTLNGFAHALMWPPLIAVMSRYLSESDYQRGCVSVNIASSVGTVAVYLISPAIIYASSVRYVFSVCGIAALAMAVFWKLSFTKMTGEGGSLCEAEGFVKRSSTDTGVHLKKNGIFFVMLAAVMIGIVIQGVLRDGVTTWMPSYVSETFNLSGKISILSGVILPLFSVISFKVSAFIYNKLIKNELLCAGAMFLAAALAACVLALFSDRSVFLSMVLSALITGCMHGINFVLICMVPPYFARYGKVSVFSGLLNSCTYVGSALSTYGFAVISNASGWGATIALWAVCAVMGVAVCFVFVRMWQRFSAR